LRIGHVRAAGLNKQTKEFSDLLGPLKRYLMRQVNRPWNKVWSEISANIKAANPAQRHVLGHVLAQPGDDRGRLLVGDQPEGQLGVRGGRRLLDQHAGAGPRGRSRTNRSHYFRAQPQQPA